MTLVTLFKNKKQNCGSEREVPEVSLYSTTEWHLLDIRGRGGATIILFTFRMTLNVSDQQRAAAQVTAMPTR